MKILTVAGFVAIVALLLAGTAGAETIALDAPPVTRSAGVPDFFPYIEDSWARDAIYTTTESPDTADIAFNPAGIPGWLHLVIPEEATLTRGRIVFKEADGVPYGGSTQTYSWGDTINFYIGETLYDGWFKVTAWDECEIRLIGSAPGWVDVYCYVEKYTDSE